MAYLAVREEDWALLDTLDALQPPDDRTPTVQEAGRLLSTRDTAAQSAFMRRMAASTGWEAFDASVGATTMGHSGIALELASMSRSPTRPERVRRQAEFMWTSIARSAGHWPGLEAPCGFPGEGQTEIRTIDQPACALIPFQPVPESDLMTLRQSVAAWPVLQDTTSNDPAVALVPHARLFILASIDARLGNTSAALAAADSLDSLPTIDRWRPTVHALAASIRSDAALRAGRPEDALRQLGEVADLPPIEMRGPILGRELERWWRAEALFQVGRDQEALSWYRNAFALSYDEFIWLPMIELRSGQIRERMGEREAAALHYAKFLRFWNDADSALTPYVEDARRSLGRLAGERPGDPTLH